jgi:hypothetical protein
MSEEIVEEQPSMKIAKSMTGHIYSYPVKTISEFIERLSKDYQIPEELIRLLDPEEDTEEDKKEDTKDEMKEDVLYVIFVDNSQSILLPWIKEEKLNGYLRINNPSYILTEEDKESYVKHHLEYIAFYPKYTEIVRNHIDKFTKRTWMRFFNNDSAGPIMEEHIDLVKEHFYDNAHWLGLNLSTIPLLERAIEEQWPVKNQESFCEKLSENENAIPLLRRYPHYVNYHGLSDNPSEDAIQYIKDMLKTDPTIVDKLSWSKLSANSAGIDLLFEYPDRVNRTSVYYNRNPRIVQWYHLYMDPSDEGWKQICYYSHPDFIYFIEQHLDNLPHSAWNSLSQNEGAIDILKKYPSKIHWGLLCNNPSPMVIPMLLSCLVEQYPALRLSSEGESVIGFSYTKHNYVETYKGKDVFDEFYRFVINRGSISLHPHALPLLERYPELIYWNSLSIHPGIYQSACNNSLL